MPVLTPTRRRAEEFAHVLDATEDLAGDPRVAPLVAVARQLQQRPLGPTPLFRARLRNRVVAVATVTTPAPTPPLRAPHQWHRRNRGLSWAAGALAVVVALGGVWTASSRALPGDFLYGVKQAAESVQLSLAGSNAERGARELQFARTRLHEIDGLLSRHDGSREVPATFAAMDHATRVGSQLLLHAYSDDRQVASLRVLDDFTTYQQQRLATVLPDLPTPVRSRARASLVLLRQVGSKVSGLLALSPCATHCTGRTPASGPSASSDVSTTPAPNASASTTLTPAPTVSASEGIDASASASAGQLAGEGQSRSSAQPSRDGSSTRPSGPPSGVLGSLLGLLGGGAAPTKSTPSPSGSMTPTPGPAASGARMSTSQASPTETRVRSPFRLPLSGLFGLFGTSAGD